MGTRAGTTESPRIVVLGSHSAFTEAAVGELCESGIAPVALVTGSTPAPAAHGSIPIEIHTPAARNSLMKRTYRRSFMKPLASPVLVTRATKTGHASSPA